MSDANFRVRTEADLGGLRAMSSMLDDIARKSKSITETWARASIPGAGHAVASSGGGGTGYAVSPANTGTPQRRQQRAGLSAGQQYNLNTPQGLYQWYENVYEPEAGVLSQMANGFQSKVFGAGRSRAPMHTTVPVAKTPAPRVIPVSDKAINQWFTGLAPKLGTMSPDIRSEYARAGFNSQTDDNAIRDFYNQYGAQLSAPQPRTVTPRVPVQTPSGGGGNGTGGGFASQFGGALGGLAKQYAPWLTVGSAVMFAGEQIKGGYNLWQQSSQPIDQLSHSLSTVAIGVENFRQQIVSTGAQFGFLSQQSAQAAQSLGQFYGNLGQNGITNAFGATALFAQQNGLSLQQATQLMNAGALSGITNGYGATMNASQYAGMMNNSVSAAGMQGRQGPYLTGLTAAQNAVVNQNGILSNPQYLSGMYAQSVATMGDMRGGQLFSTLNSSVMNATGYNQGILFAAMQRTLGGKLGNQDIVSVLAAQQEGLSSNVPGTNVKLGASLYSYLKNSGFSYDQQVMMLAPYFGGNVNQAEQFLRNPNSFGQVATSTHNSQGTWYSMFGLNQRASANYQSSKSNFGTAVAPFATAFHSLGSPLATAATLAGSYVVGKYGLRGAGRFLGRSVSTLAGRGVTADGFATMVGDSSPSLLARVGSGLGSIWSRFGGVIKGVGLDALGAGEEVGGTALDATGIGAAGGIPLNILGAATIAAGTGMAVHGLMTSHANAAASHATQVRQQATQRSNSNIGTMTIGNLKINQISLPAGASGASALSSGINSGTTYAPSSGNASGGGGWWGNFTNWVGNLFTGGGGGGIGGGGGPAPSSLSGNGNAQQIWNFLRGKGLSAGAAAGIMGNLDQESGFNPGAVNKSSGAFGIAQWLGGRQTALDAYAKANGESPSSLKAQLGYLWKEISSGNYISTSALNQMGPSQAAQYFETAFEKAGAGANMGARIADASSIYGQYVNLSPQSATNIGNAVASAIHRYQMSGGAVRP